jgi:predicted transcriptional regulator
MKRRSKIDIYAEILNQAKEGTTKTRIMYQVNLSFFQLKQLLNELLSLKLIEIQSLLYKTTLKGLHFLKLYDEIQSFISPSTYSAIATQY